MLLDEIKSIKATRRELRKFGLTVGIFLLIITGFLFWKQRPSFLYFGYVGASFLLVGLTLPFVLKSIHKAWMSIAMITGFIMTRVILCVLFFGLFTPIGLVVRLLRRDLLNQRWDRKAGTYWVKRAQRPFNPESAENMF